MITAQRPTTHHPVPRIAAWVQPELVLLDIEARDRFHALEIAAVAAARSRDLDPAPWLRALWRREHVGSTALGSAVAIPHAQVAGITEPMTVYVRFRSPVDFDAPDGEPVAHLLVILVPPDDAREDHLQLLAVVASLFSVSDFRERLLRAPTGAAVANVFSEGIEHAVSAA